MGGLLLLLALCAVMALASFLAGALPLSMTLTQPQLRLISSIGVGILVGTALIVIIPEGVEAIANPLLNPQSSSPAVSHDHAHSARQAYQLPGGVGMAIPVHARSTEDTVNNMVDDVVRRLALPIQGSRTASKYIQARSDASGTSKDADKDEDDAAKDTKDKTSKEHKQEAGKEKEDLEPQSLPTFHIGFALVSGFVVMFLIDRLPRHAVDRLQSGPTTRHISLDDLASPGGLGDDGDDDDDDMNGGSGRANGRRGGGGRLGDEEGFLGSLTPTPRQSRGLATTVGLVIHAAADGIAMGASATTEDMKLGLVIFVAIMVHKAPAAFGLTSVLLKHGLSKRAARGHLVVFSLAAPFGAVVTYITISLVAGGPGAMEGDSGQWWTGMLLLFSAGTFLYVAMQAMQEDAASGYDSHHYHLGGGGGGIGGGGGYGDGSGGGGLAAQRKQNRPQLRDTMAMIGGMLLPLLTQFGHHH